MTINKLNIDHPVSRNCFPPANITKYATRHMPSKTTAKDMRKPTVRHIEQK